MGSLLSSLMANRSVQALTVGYIVYMLLNKRRTPQKKIKGPPLTGSDTMDMRRKAQVASGRATDHSGEVRLLPMVGFDIDKTIFGSLDEKLVRAVITERLAVELYWSDSAVMRINASYNKIPADLCPAPERDIMDFIKQDCDFAMEHADGSFMDHLLFCAHYSAVHYNKYSPRVLFLHSIMGVGTNFFPMGKDKIPKLKSLLTPFEYTHIEAFPTVLRLVNHQGLLPELNANRHRLDKLQKITFHRVIDNAEISLTAKDLWVQLNYQLMHLLDFLPAANWVANMDDSFLCNFMMLHDCLATTGNKGCVVDFTVPDPSSPGDDGKPLTLLSFVKGLVPSSIIKNIGKKQIAKFSNKIGHSLNYTLHWE